MVMVILFIVFTQILNKKSHRNLKVRLQLPLVTRGDRKRNIVCLIQILVLKQLRFRRCRRLLLGLGIRRLELNLSETFYC